MFAIILKVGLEECQLNLDNVQSYEVFDKSGFGEVMTLVNVNPTILEECQLCMHVVHKENILCDIYVVEFAYDPTCNYYKRGKYDCRNFHVTKLPLVMMKFLLFLSASLHMLVFASLISFELYSFALVLHLYLLEHGGGFVL